MTKIKTRRQQTQAPASIAPPSLPLPSPTPSPVPTPLPMSGSDEKWFVNKLVGLVNIYHLSLWLELERQLFNTPLLI